MAGRNVLITGCSSGIGLTCATGLKARGWRVLATARKNEDLAMLAGLGLEAIQLDYRHSDSVQACAAEVSRRTDGKLFALFNNGAYGQPGAVEDISRAVLEEQFAANFFGWHELTRACLPMMRSLGEGRIVQCSSVLGLLAMKWHASKFALEGLTDTLRLELRDTGIRVVTINPGPIESKFVSTALAHFEQNIDQANSNYKAAYERQRARLTKGGTNRFKLPPTAVLDKLVLALESPNPRPHYYVTTPTWIAAVVKRMLPQSMIDAFANRASDS